MAFVINGLFVKQYLPKTVNKLRSYKDDRGYSNLFV